jgi:hypothetical protein
METKTQLSSDGSRQFKTAESVINRQRFMNKTPVYIPSFLESIYTYSGKAVVYLDSHFYILWANDLFAELNDSPPDVLTYKSFLEIIPQAKHETILQQVRQRGEPYFEDCCSIDFSVQPNDGLCYWDEEVFPIYDSHGNLDGILLTFLEATGRVLAEKKNGAIQMWMQPSP